MTRASMARFRFFSLVLLVVFVLLPARRVFAGNISYPQNSYLYFSGNGVTLTLMGGSSADTVVMAASTVAVTLAAGDSLELLDPSNRHLQNTQGLAECTTDAQGNHLVMGPFGSATTIVVTPTLTDCGGNGGGGAGGGSGGGGNTNSGSNANQVLQNANSSLNTNILIDPNANTNANSPVNTNASTNSNLPAQNANTNTGGQLPTNSSPNTNGGGAGTNAANGPGATNSAGGGAVNSGSGSGSGGSGGAGSGTGGTTAGAPVITTPGNGTIVAVTQPVVSGSAAAQDVVSLLLDNLPIGTVIADAAGIWSFPVPQPLAGGGHLIVAVANGLQSAPVQFVIDVTPPGAPQIVEATLLATQLVAGKMYDASFLIRGVADEQEDVLFSFDGGTVLKGLTTQSGAWQTTLYATLTEGDHTLSVQAVDVLGNVSAATVLSFHIPLPGKEVVVLREQASGTVPVVIATPACADGKDNDGDGWVDFPADAGCASREGTDEASDKRSVLTSVQTLLPALTPTLAPIAAVIENPVVQQVNQTVAAPTALVIVSANAAAALPQLGFLTYLRFLFLQPLLLFRRRRGWGTVYNSMTKLPVDLAIVRLYDTGSNRLVRTTVTDRNGRFLFFVPPGSFRVEVTKPQFVFPSAYVQPGVDDVQYTNVYHGTPFVVQSAAMIAPNIPLDPHVQEKADHLVVRDAFKRKAHTLFSALGIFLAAGIWFVSPTVVNSIALVAHVGMFFVFRRLARGFTPKTWGIISDVLHRKPLAASVVRIFEPTYNRLLDTQVTDASGRYAFLVGRNKYYLTAAKPGYKPARSSLLDLSNGPDRAVVAENVTLEPLAQQGPPVAPPAAVSAPVETATVAVPQETQAPPPTTTPGQVV